MNKSRKLSTASLMLVLAACGSEQKPAEPTPVADTVFRDMADAVGKARGVEETLQQQKDKLDRTLQENEHPTAE